MHIYINKYIYIKIYRYVYIHYYNSMPVGNLYLDNFILIKSFRHG